MTDEPGPGTSYRLYVTNGRGRINSVAQEIMATSDEDAFHKAMLAVGDVWFELWKGDRLLAIDGHGVRDADRPGDQGH